MNGRLGKYRLEARLGGGGMAEVFLASTVGAEGFSRRVALKRVLPGFSEDPTFARMFIDEARISSRLVHPNVVSVLDFDRDAEGRLYLVLELVEGRDLAGLAATGMLPIPVVLHVTSEMLRGLGYAHDLPVGPTTSNASSTLQLMRGIVHRDVSPQNVLLSWEGEVKVSDFGIAKARSASEATGSELIKGKPAYMSPEQANGEPLDGRSDLFAVGTMLWELLVGRRLFAGADTRSTIAAVLFGQIPRPRSLRGDVPRDVERVVMRLLEREPPARYATAEDALAELLRCEAAPRDGREQLKQTLSERFPDQAPVRHSVMRSRSGRTPQSVPLDGTACGRDGPSSSEGEMLAPPSASVSPSLDEGPSRPHAVDALSLGALRAAQTGTMQPGDVTGPTPSARPAASPPSASARRTTRAVVAVMAAIVAISFVIAVVADGQESTPPGWLHPAAPPLAGQTGSAGATEVTASAAAGQTGSAGATEVTANAAAGPTGSAGATEVTASAAAGQTGSAGATEVAASATAGPTGSAGATEVTANVAAGPTGSAGATEVTAHVGTPGNAGTVSAGQAGGAGVAPGAGAAKKDATGARPGENRGGRLLVRAFPVLTVYVDNKKIRDTPVDMQLPAGKHKVRLVNTASGTDESLTVTIHANRTTTIDRN